MVYRRAHEFSMLISDEEHRMLQELAERAGLTPGDYVRMLVHRQYTDELTEQPATRVVLKHKS